MAEEPRGRGVGAEGPGALGNDEACPHRGRTQSNRHTCKIADFGLSTQKEASATVGRVGTPMWCAPEVLRMDRYDAATADL